MPNQPEYHEHERDQLADAEKVPDPNCRHCGGKGYTLNICDQGHYGSTHTCDCVLKTIPKLADAEPTLPGEKAGPVSHEEARQILKRYNDGHWKQGPEVPRYTIPADPMHDDDIRLGAYIDQQRKRDTARRELAYRVRLVAGRCDPHPSTNVLGRFVPKGFLEEIIAALDPKENTDEI